MLEAISSISTLRESEHSIMSGSFSSARTKGSAKFHQNIKKVFVGRMTKKWHRVLREFLDAPSWATCSKWMNLRLECWSK